MLTPQEVAEHAFGKASFNGYNMAQVDDFLDEVTRDYETLFNDNTLLKQKLGVLSGKIKEYQSTEEAMRKTLLTAQTMADEMVKEAEAKRDALLQEAEAEIRARIAAIELEERTEQARLRAAHGATEQYVATVRDLLRKETALLDRLNEITPPQPEPPPADDGFDRIADAVEQAVEQETQAAEHADSPDAEDDGATRTIGDHLHEHEPESERGKRPARRADKFAELGMNFGKEYEIK